VNNTLVIIAIVALAVLAAAAAALQHFPSRIEAPRYRRQSSVLTNAEQAFYRRLAAGVGADYLIWPKMRILDVMTPADGRIGSWNRISSKHVDFVLVDPISYAPVAAIELDDASHHRPDRQERDAVVNNAFASAGIPLVRVPARKDWSAEQLRRTIDEAIDRAHV